MLSERSQSRRTDTVGFPLHELPSIATITEAGRRTEGAGSWIEGVNCNGYGVSVWEDAEFCRWMVIMVA